MKKLMMAAGLMIIIGVGGAQAEVISPILECNALGYDLLDCMDFFDTYQADPSMGSGLPLDVWLAFEGFGPGNPAVEVCMNLSYPAYECQQWTFQAVRFYSFWGIPENVIAAWMITVWGFPWGLWF